MQVNFDAYPSEGVLTGPGQLRVIDSVGGGVVKMGGFDLANNPIPNNYTGGTTVLSGTLQVLYPTALPSVGVLTVGGPESLVLSAQTGTLLGSATDSASTMGVVGVTGPGEVTEEALAEPVAPVAFATGVSMVPFERSRRQSLSRARWPFSGAGLISLLGVAWRRRNAG